MEIEAVINNTINVILNNCNIIFPNSNNRKDYYNYLSNILNTIKNPKHVPTYLYSKLADKEKYLQNAMDELARIESGYVKGDSFGDGMPHGPGNPNSVNEMHERALELKEEIIPYYQKEVNKVNDEINALDIDFDMAVKDNVAALVSLIPNPKHMNVVMDFYIYRKSYKTIANENYMSEATAHQYRVRGFNSLNDILYNFSQKNGLKV